MGVVLLMAVLLMGGCSAGEDIDEADKPVPVVVARFNFSLPNRIVSKKAQTRMTGGVVQESGVEEDFRGLDDIHLLCYNQAPTESSNKIGNVIEMNTQSNDVTEEVTTDDYSISKEIDVPVGTSYFGFYANASEEAVPTMTEHERRMHYGVMEAIGIGKRDYQGNSAIRFRPVPICNSTDELGGSAIGQALLNLLNYLMNIKVNEPAPNDQWATAGNLYLNEAYQRMKTLTTLSSYNVQTMLGAVVKIVNQKAPDEQAKKLVEAITKEIKKSCNPEYEPDIVNGIIVLKDSYQGFPADIHLPAGAARIAWNVEENCFEPVEQAYGKGLNIPSINDYVYPMSLQYQVFSDIVASDELVINDVNSEGEIVAPDNPKYDTWRQLLEEGYGEDAAKSVQSTTRSVAMVQQVEYAVGSLALRARISPEGNGFFYDAKGKQVDINNGFTLKGYIVGGQREVDYNFQPVADSHVYAIYDTDLEGDITHVYKHGWNEADNKFDYILGLSTMTDKNIYLAMELVNDCPDFQGADGVITHGSTFYLVANLELPDQTSANIPRQIFSKDHATQVDLTIVNGWPDKNGDGIPDPDNDEHGNPKPISGLATATYGLPNLEVPHPTVGLSVDLSWGEGLWFDDIEL